MKKILLLLFLTSSICHAQVNKFFINGKVKVADDSYFSNVSTDQTDNVISVSFTTNIANQNQPPSFELVTISGTEIKEETLTVSVEGFYSPGGYAEGTHTYQWYRADDNQSVGSAISGATSSTYLLTIDDVAKYIRCIATPVQVGGLNTTGSGVTSVYSGQIQDNEFNPLTDITWFTAHTPAGATDLAGVGWVNYGTGNNSTQNSSDPIPTYVTDVGVDFEASNNEELVLDQPGTQFTMPVEVWIRCRFESFNASWAYLLDWNGAQRVEQRTSGAIYLSNGNCDYTPPLNKWIIMRFVISGTSNTSKFKVNDGTLKTNVAAVTTAFGTSNGRIGSNATGTGNRADVLYSHIFIRQGELDSTNENNMDDWFAANAPYEP